MKHTPFGYDIVDGMAVVNEAEAEQLQTLFAGYLLAVAQGSRRDGGDKDHAQPDKEDIAEQEILRG